MKSFSPLPAVVISLFSASSVYATVYSYAFTGIVTDEAPASNPLSGFANIGNPVTGTITYDSDLLAPEIVTLEGGFYSAAPGGVNIEVIVGSNTWQLTTAPDLIAFFGAEGVITNNDAGGNDSFSISTDHGDFGGATIPGVFPGSGTDAVIGLGVLLLDDTSPFTLLSSGSDDQPLGDISSGAGYIGSGVFGTEGIRFSIGGITPIPEPSVAALSLVAFVTTALRRKRTT